MSINKEQYGRFRDYLDIIKITLTYKEIENILRSELPLSAYKHYAWWDNNTDNHTQMHSWRGAGWKVVKVELGKTVTFQKISSGYDD